MENQTILVTGGLGYIGSHTVVKLIEQGFKVVVLDNLSNSSPKVVSRLNILNSSPLEVFFEDLLNHDALENIFEKYNFDAVIHLAGLKSVRESFYQPLLYFQNNVSGTVSLLNQMCKSGVKKIVFSSSATVYGNPDRLPICEDFPLRVSSPYGRTKLMCEDFLRDLHFSDPSLSIAILRYFNPVGAHYSGLLGESPIGVPNNLMPFITQVASRQRQNLEIFGDDYDTPDGTCIRDYLHVSDLADGHIAALKIFDTHRFFTVNLGTGRGISVKELINTFIQVNNIEIPYIIAQRREGDVASCYANVNLAKEILNWEAKKSIQDMCKDACRWQLQNPLGYDSEILPN